MAVKLRGDGTTDIMFVWFITRVLFTHICSGGCLYSVWGISSRLDGSYRDGRGAGRRVGGNNNNNETARVTAKCGCAAIILPFSFSDNAGWLKRP